MNITTLMLITYFHNKINKSITNQTEEPFRRASTNLSNKNNIIEEIRNQQITENFLESMEYVNISQYIFQFKRIECSINVNFGDFILYESTNEFPKMSLFRITSEKFWFM